jgi:hypothetical protein
MKNETPESAYNFPMSAVRMTTAIVFLLLSALHIYWASGGHWASENAVPSQGERPLFTPSKLATVVVAMLLLMAAMIIFLRVHPPARPTLEFITRWGAWILSAIFALRAIGDFHWIGFFKTVRETAFGMLDSWVYSPLCLLLAVGSAVAAMRR